MTLESLQAVLPVLLGLAVLLPLASFALIWVLCGTGLWTGRNQAVAGYVASGAIISGFALSAIALACWLSAHGYPSGDHHDEHHAAAAHHDPHESADGDHGADAEHGADGHAGEDAAEHAETDHAGEHDAATAPPVTGVFYELGRFGSLRLELSYYIDSLTVCMFFMVTLIASCIHVYATGYMHDELHDEWVDHEVTLSDGHHLHRPGRFHRFFMYLSLFCFSMLGLVISGNMLQTFMFWELVGVCSYFLIGFYVERHSASTAANKAFIVNRVGDFGMIIGLMALLGALGTFSFGDVQRLDDSGAAYVQPGIFSLVRPAENGHALVVPEGFVLDGAREQLRQQQGQLPDAAQLESWRAGQPGQTGYWLMMVAGLGIFCGCVGKSAQFPLHVWLPDAMEGPTPVSALVHSATMVAAGVFLAARFFPAFTSEVLLVIAVVGAITLFLAASIALTARDIKRVLAYSTVSQLGYMMMALGLGAWMAGVLHLFTHAFFKSLLFLCSGSVIHAVHSNDLFDMGGLRKKMPCTAYTMLVGCLAIIGAGLPITVFGYHIGLSGYYSKDAILAQAFLFGKINPPIYAVFFYVSAFGAAMTAFYMFRLWFLAFAGKPRDHHRYEHAHESPPSMCYPLVLLSVLAVVAAWPVPLTGGLSLSSLLSQSYPQGPPPVAQSGGMLAAVVPDEAASHAAEIHDPVLLVAFGTALGGVLLAALFYGLNALNPADVRNQFGRMYQFLRNKWYFDELYDALFVRTTHRIAALAAWFDRTVIDGIVDGCAAVARRLAVIDDLVDRFIVDKIADLIAAWTYSLGMTLRNVQTGLLRQYVVLIVVGTVGLFVVASFLWSFAREAAAF